MSSEYRELAAQQQGLASDFIDGAVLFIQSAQAGADGGEEAAANLLEEGIEQLPD